MNVKSQATIAYAYALGNLKIRSITTSNVVSTEVRTVDLLAKKIASAEYFRPGDVITYSIILTNPGNSKATNITINDELFRQSLVKDSFRYLFLDDSKADIKLTINDNNLVFEVDEVNPHAVCVLTYQVTVDEIDEICLDLRNCTSVSCKEVNPFALHKFDIKQRYAKIECLKKTVDHVYLNSDIAYEIIITNKGNVEAVDLELIDQLPQTFELDHSKDAITIDNVECDIFTFDKNTNLLKLIIDRVEPFASVKVIVKGKITK
ncbi:MAG: DUF11 domain-containing protein [Acholeplasmataceae bacterium]|nr:DUF11 domain-containing protein [Acholeplasmataceae bacterium]